MAVQLEFNIDDESEIEIKLGYMQKKLDEMADSMGKVRRKLFSEMTEIKKENIRLKQMIEGMQSEKVTWEYAQGHCLFDAKIN